MLSVVAKRSSNSPIGKDGVRTLSLDRKSTRLNSSHGYISYAVFCLKKKKKHTHHNHQPVSRLQRHPTTPLHSFHRPNRPPSRCHAAPARSTPPSFLSAHGVADILHH